MAVQPHTKITADEFYTIAENTDQRLELIHGAIIEMATPTPEHQTLIVVLIQMLTGLIPQGKLFIAPLDVVLDDETIVQPDVMWLAHDSRCVVEKKKLRGAPDLIIEVLSPSTMRRDRTVKFELYEKFGVREYWMIDPLGILEAWSLIDKVYTLIGQFRAGEVFVSPVLNGQVDVGVLFTNLET
jgi:Uma2 family endonuclease